MKVIFVPCIPKMIGRRYNFPKTFADMGHEVHVLTWELPYQLSNPDKLRHLKTSWHSEEYKHENFYVHKIARLPFFWPVVNGILFKYQLKKLYKSVNADIVVSQSYTNEHPIPKKLPLVYDLMDDHVAMSEVYGSAVYKFAFRLLGVRSTIRRQCKNALAVITVSELMQRLAKKHNSNVYKIPNGVNKQTITAISRSSSRPNGNPHSLIYVSGFNQWARPIETMKCVLDLRKDFPDIELTLIGGGTEASSIKQFIRKHNAEAFIHYLGPIYDQKEVYKAISQHSIGLSMSEKNKLRDAASSAKVFEYSGFGKKVVSTNLEETVRLALPNVHIFEYKTRTSMKRAIRKTLLDQTDYSYMKARILRNYSWEKLASKLEMVIKEELAR